MRLSQFFVSATLAATASAAPSFPELNIKDARTAGNALGDLSTYFNLLATKVTGAQWSGQMPSCDLSKAQMPTDEPKALGAPDKGLILKHVAVGRGTQNYTCDTSDPSSAPTAAGALATLFNASCIAALYPQLLESIPAMAVHFDMNSNDQQLGPAEMSTSGEHYFLNGATPFFDLTHGTDDMNLGEAPCTKNNTSPAPSGSATGQNGEAAVPWLRLTANEGATGGLKNVYRMRTAGGSAPATCQGMDASFQVQYSAIYWFWATV